MKHSKLQTKTKARKRRGNSRYFLFFIIILIGIAALGFTGFEVLSRMDMLDVRQIEISGNSAVADSLLRAELKPYLGQNLLKVDKKQVSQRVTAFARVKEARVRRKLFNTLLVQVTERKASLYVKSLEGELFPIDAEGVVLERFGSVYTENLPLVGLLLSNSEFKSGEKIKNASLNRILATHSRILKEAPDFAQNVSEYYTLDNVVYIVDIRGGERIIPGEKNLAKQLSRYEFVRDNGNIAPSAILDLRLDNQVLVKKVN
ncbi:MAG: FtsQ-type POTRA domain-containing protein [Candidatus Cloacimonadaceae bacterium]|jgi:cell division protein FtsQ|nr:FtsQ-type POTRA domain-containing protein [Candidatus Cloacimonadota bacterium]NLN84518.1 FtsQ-type POTRA domain-containing protein [Candidatus Cloacimonadota bacterium]